MATKKLPDPDMLRQLLRYDPETGKLFWRERPVSMFADGDHSAEHSCRAWNAKRAGTEAFTTTDNVGRRHGNINKKSLKAHRVAWAVYYGEWPAGEIDHINGNPSDNRIGNLREASSAQNKWNRPSRPGSASRYVGVSITRSGKWFAQIIVAGEYRYLGSFETQEEAAKARDLAAIEAHGEFARLNFKS